MVTLAPDYYKPIPAGNVDLSDVFLTEERQDWKLCEEAPVSSPEYTGRVDGTHVIARVQGPFFLVDEISLNNRRYTKPLWEKTISKVSEKLGKGGLFGAIGHDQKLDEKALAEGKFSHTVSKLWITEDNIGMGEILVLGTEAGRHLNTLLRAGMPIPVSSRAYGKITGKGPLGEDLIDPDSFHLETFDFVLNPGVSSAYVQVVENVAPIVEEPQPIEEDNGMDPVTKQLNEEKLALHEKLAEVLETNQKLLSKNESLTEKLAVYEKNIGSTDNAKGIMEDLRKWLELEPFRTVAFETGLLAQDGLKPTEVINKLTGLVESYSKLGTPEKLQALKESQAAYEALGTPEELSKVLDIVEQYNELGTIEEMDKVLDVLEAYIQMGTPAAIQEKLETANNFAEQVMETKRKLAAKKIAAKLNVNESVAFEMVKSMGVKATIEALSKLQESVTVTNRYRVSEPQKLTEEKLPGRSVRKAEGWAASFFESVPEPTMVPLDARN